MGDLAITHRPTGGALSCAITLGALACDFFVTITATFRTVYVFVVLDVGTRRIVTEHPTSEWTIQQFRAIVPGDQPQRFFIHDRDSIVIATPILAGLHHDYQLERLAA